MAENREMDKNIGQVLKSVTESWRVQRRYLTNMTYFSLAVIILVFINLDKISLVAGSAVVKVIDVFGLLIMFLVPIWSYYERSQGDRLVRAISLMGGDSPGSNGKEDAETVAQAVDFSESGDKAYYSFALMMSGMGIIVLNVIAYIVYGPS